MKIMLTGCPGSGKTTVIRKVVEALSCPSIGFFTAEIREGSKRVGFSVESLDGRKGIMSHVNIGGPFRVGRYGVDVTAFEAIALPALEPEDAKTLVIVDEIGKMECFSQSFIGRIKDLLAMPNPLLGTVARKGSGFPAEIRNHPIVEIIEITSENRDAVPAILVEKIEKSLSP